MLGYQCTVCTVLLHVGKGQYKHHPTYCINNWNTSIVEGRRPSAAQCVLKHPHSKITVDFPATSAPIVSSSSLDSVEGA